MSIDDFGGGQIFQQDHTKKIEGPTRSLAPDLLGFAVGPHDGWAWLSPWRSHHTVALQVYFIKLGHGDLGSLERLG